MAWLQKRPQVAMPINYFTIGQNSTLIIAGLGNPGAKYTNTRHNIGFECLDYFIVKNEEMHDWVEKKDLKCLFSSGRIGDSQVIAIKPTTYMNLSGESVGLVLNFYKAKPDKLVVVHDELDIPFGDIRTRNGGSDAGHNGIKSINSLVGDNYNHIKIGIGPKSPKEIDSADFVLNNFTTKEQKQLSNLKKETIAILSEYIFTKHFNQETRNFII